MPISAELAREIFLIEIWHIGALIFLFWINGFFYRNATPGILKNSYLLLQSLIYLWIVAKILKTVAPNETLRWGFIILQYLGISFIGPIYFIFSWIFLFKEKPSNKLIVPILFISFFFFIFIALNPFHHLFYSTYNFYRDTFGIGYYYFIGYQYSLLGLAVILNMWGVFRSVLSDILLALVALPSIIYNILYSFDFLTPLFDITPILMSISLVVFGFAAFKNDFMGALPIARFKFIQIINDPIIVTKSNGVILWSYNYPKSIPLNTEFYYNNRFYTLLSHKKKKGFEIRHYIDITEIKQLQKSLQVMSLEIKKSINKLEYENNKKINSIKNNVIQNSRRNLHDILGHSLTVVLCMLRQSKNNPENLTAVRDKMSKIIDKAYLECKSKLKNQDNIKMDSSQSLTITLQPLIKQSLDVVSISYYVKGSEKPLPNSIVNELYQCTREAITNALKHGKATHIEIMIAYEPEQIRLWVIDNGIGCNSIHFGNGLSLMQHGLDKWKGVLRCSSEPGEGFQLTYLIPINPQENKHISHNLPVTNG